MLYKHQELQDFDNGFFHIEFMPQKKQIFILFLKAIGGHKKSAIAGNLRSLHHIKPIYGQDYFVSLCPEWFWSEDVSFLQICMS